MPPGRSSYGEGAAMGARSHTQPKAAPGRRGRAVLIFGAVVLLAVGAEADPAKPVKVAAQADRLAGTLVLDWPGPITYSVTETGPYVLVRFSRPLEASLERARGALGRHLEELRLAGGARVLVIRVAGEPRFAHRKIGNSVVLTWAVAARPRPIEDEGPSESGAAPHPPRFYDAAPVRPAAAPEYSQPRRAEAPAAPETRPQSALEPAPKRPSARPAPAPLPKASVAEESIAVPDPGPRAAYAAAPERPTARPEPARSPRTTDAEPAAAPGTRLRAAQEFAPPERPTARPEPSEAPKTEPIPEPAATLDPRRRPARASALERPSARPEPSPAKAGEAHLAVAAPEKPLKAAAAPSPERPAAPPAPRLEPPALPQAETPTAAGTPRADEAVRPPATLAKAPASEPAKPEIRPAPEARPAPNGNLEPPVMPAITPKLSISNEGGETRIVFAWPEPVAAAVFRYGDHVWMVFPRREKFEIESLQRQLGPGVEGLVRIPHAQATVLGLRARSDMRIRVAHERNVWTVSLKRENEVPPLPEAKLALSPSNAEQAVVPLPGAEVPARLVIPEIGSTVHVIPSRALIASQGKRAFVTFRLLPAIQGAAIEALADGVTVDAEGGAILIRRSGGLMLSNEDTGQPAQ